MPEQKQSLAEVLPQAKKPLNKNLNINKESENKTHLHFLRLVIIAGIILVFGLAITAWGNYTEGWQNYFIDSVNKIVPFPAASIGYGNWISINEYNRNVKAMRQFLESKEAANNAGKFDFSTPEGLKRLAIIKKNILNQLIDNKLTEVIAKQQGITIGDSELSNTTSKIITRDGKQNENIAQLNALYGWTTDDFKNIVIKNLLYEQKLEDKIKSNGELDANAKQKLNQIKDKIIAGEKFSDIAKELSDSPSKQYGGLLPAFSQEDAPKVFADVAFKLGVGEISDPIEADDGWHIIKVEKKFTQDGKDKIEVSHIFVKRELLKDWLAKQKNTYQIKVFMKPYYWHGQMGRLYFKDESLNQYEDNVNRVNLNEKTQETDFLLNSSNKNN